MASRVARRMGTKAALRARLRKPRGVGQPTYREAAVNKARRSVRAG